MTIYVGLSNMFLSKRGYILTIEMLGFALASYLIMVLVDSLLSGFQFLLAI